MHFKLSWQDMELPLEPAKPAGRTFDHVITRVICSFRVLLGFSFSFRFWCLFLFISLYVSLVHPLSLYFSLSASFLALYPCLSLCLSVLSVLSFLAILSVFLSFDLSLSLSFSFFPDCLSVEKTIILFSWISFSILYLSIYLFVRPSIIISTCLSIYLSI